MGAVARAALVTVAVAALTLAQAAPGQATAEPRLMCFGQPATIVGTPGPDVLGGGADDVVVGLGGDDWLWGGIVCGGAGNDTIFGPEDSWANAKLDGGRGDDQLMSGFGVDVLLGGPGNDYLKDSDDEDNPDWADPGTDVMKGGPGDDWIYSTAGRNLVYGNAGDDHIRDYTHVRTVISGGSGNDTIDATLDNYGDNPYQPDAVAGDAGTDWATVNRVDKVRTTERITYVDEAGLAELVRRQGLEPRTR